MERFTFTVGKLDAGMAILIGERAHLIEFPSLLLPPGVTSGSIVNISVNRNLAAEKTQLKEFWSLQDSILQEYGLDSPSPPDLKLRHVTQTSVTLEWPALNMAKADIRSLEIYKNGERLATIPNPKVNTSTKLSSLQSNEEYTFQLILKTTAGTYPSNIIRVRTHTMNDTSGISVCFGNIEDPTLLAQVKSALDGMRAKWTEKIQIDTTHFVCTSAHVSGSGAGYGDGSLAPSVEYQKATQMSLPIVNPHWILACYGEKKLVPVKNYHPGSTYYLGFPPSNNPPAPTPSFDRKLSDNSRRNSMADAAAQLEQDRFRAPSPETIARMNMDAPAPSTRAGEGQAGSGSGAGARGGRTGPPELEEIGTVPGPASGSGEGTMRGDPASPPKSPKPESIGKLDRRFKFPTSSGTTGSPVSPVGAGGGGDVGVGVGAGNGDEAGPSDQGGKEVNEKAQEKGEEQEDKEDKEEDVRPISNGSPQAEVETVEPEPTPSPEPTSISPPVQTEPASQPGSGPTASTTTTTTGSSTTEDLDLKAKSWMDRQDAEGGRGTRLLSSIEDEVVGSATVGPEVVGPEAKDPEVAEPEIVEPAAVEPTIPESEVEPEVEVHDPHPHLHLRSFSPEKKEENDLSSGASGPVEGEKKGVQEGEKEEGLVLQEEQGGKEPGDLEDLVTLQNNSGAVVFENQGGVGLGVGVGGGEEEVQVERGDEAEAEAEGEEVVEVEEGGSVPTPSGSVGGGKKKNKGKKGKKGGK